MMRYFLVLLLCVPIQLMLTVYRSPVEKFLINMAKVFYSKMETYFNYLTTDEMKIKAQYSKPAEYKAESEQQISTINRPEGLKYRVGYVVVNVSVRYIGIVVGWRIDKDSPKASPIYEIITDHPKISDFKTTASEDELVHMEYIQIYHPESHKYFDEFDEYKSQYVPKPWLRILYPTD